MRVLNIYTYKGPKQSIVGPWVTCGYFIEDSYLDKENCVPGLKHIFDPRTNLDKFDDLLNNNIDIHTIYSHVINHQGDYAVRESRDSLVRRCSWRGRKFHINNIVKPKTWYERLTVITAVFYRRQHLHRWSNPDCDLLELDKDLNSHINKLITYKHLPPMYLWDKTMEAIKNVEPKPRWWFSEKNSLRREIEYDEPC